MSDFSAIKAVTQTLEQLLVQELSIAVEVKKAPHDISSDAALVGLFLYRVELNPFFNNLDWQKTSSTQLQAPPFGLNLHYLVTPYGPDQLEIQKTLGEVMRTFQERSVIVAGDPLLPPELATMTEELRIVPRSLALSDALEMWKSFERVPYRLAVTYEVSAVLIDSLTVRNVVPVQERHVDLGVLR